MNTESLSATNISSADGFSPPLMPANENPWYCLATMHGEQPLDRIDEQLAGKNYEEWSRWLEGDGHIGEQFRKTFFRRTEGKMAIPDRTAPWDFSNTHFSRKVIFRNFRFRGSADFNRSVFAGGADFSATRFYEEADLRWTQFASEATFASSQFSAAADFRNSTFDEVDFSAAKFRGATFRKATFSGYANFTSGSFAEAVTFASSNFRDVADFSSTKFSSGANFVQSKFSGSAVFQSSEFGRKANFSGATFTTRVSFVDAKFSSTTIFAGARFVRWVPDFRGATLHEATEWHNVIWPGAPANKAEAQRQVYNYERLKKEMEQLKKHEDEQSFFRLELRARRGLLQIATVGWVLNFLYEILSGYGNSVSRPLLWLGGLFTASTAAFGSLPINCGTVMPFRLAIKRSFANTFAFLPNMRELMLEPAMVKCLSTKVAAFSAAQSILSAVLLFLIGLALRNRFRMK